MSNGFMNPAITLPPGKGTVPKGAPNNNSAEVPQQISTGATQTTPPGKPSAVTGLGGPSVSIPKVGKGGK